MENGKISGFYYDEQLSNRLTSVTLHVNTNPDGNKYTGETDGSDDEYPYSTASICSSIFTENFTVNISNNWTGNEGRNAIETGWDTVNSLSGYADPLKNILSKVSGTLSDLVEKRDSNPDKKKTYLGNIASSLLKKDEGTGKSKLDNTLDQAAKYANSVLIVQGTRFSYFAGTDFSFGNLGMKFTLFPDYVDGTWTTVTDKVDEFLPYFLGAYEKVNVNGTEVQNYVGFQTPPAGFESKMQSQDTVNKGTLKLRLGPHYFIDNLVCKDVQFSYSPQMVKEPKPDTTSVSLSPLYCEVSLLLQPASKYTDSKLKEFVKGDDTLTDLNTILGEKLKATYDELAGIYK